MIDLKYSYSVALKGFTDLGISMTFTSQHLNVGQDIKCFLVSNLSCFTAKQMPKAACYLRLSHRL